jgi:hypothetical protein
MGICDRMWPSRIPPLLEATISWVVVLTNQRRSRPIIRPQSLVGAADLAASRAEPHRVRSFKFKLFDKPKFAEKPHFVSAAKRDRSINWLKN